MNSVNLVGRLSKDPETRDNGNKQITSLTLVTDRVKIVDGKVERDDKGYPSKDSEFHRITVFDKQGVAVREHKTKGDLLSIRGRIHYSRYERNGETVFSTEIIAEEVVFLS
jgi:single-strand DNA-binding protein